MKWFVKYFNLKLQHQNTHRSFSILNVLTCTHTNTRVSKRIQLAWQVCVCVYLMTMLLTYLLHKRMRRHHIPSTIFLHFSWSLFRWNASRKLHPVSVHHIGHLSLGHFPSTLPWIMVLYLAFPVMWPKYCNFLFYYRCGIYFQFVCNNRFVSSMHTPPDQEHSSVNIHLLGIYSTFICVFFFLFNTPGFWCICCNWEYQCTPWLVLTFSAYLCLYIFFPVPLLHLLLSQGARGFSFHILSYL